MTVVKELITKLTFKVNKKGIERYERDVKRMTRELTRLSAEARKPLVVRFNKRSLHDATKSLREAKTEARGLKNAARGNFNIRLNVTGEGAVRSARQQVERLRRSQRSAGASGYVAGRMARGGRGGMGSLAGMALLGGGGYSAYRLASFIGGAGGEEELLQARLGRMLGSKTAAIDTMNRQRNFAAVTPYTTSELTSGYIDIAAQGVKLTNDQQTALGDLAAMSGKSYGELMEAMKSANRGMGSMVDNFVGLKAKAKDGRLEMQMLDNVTGKWVKKMVDAGDMKGIVDFFVKGGKRSNIAGTMSDMSQTMPGKTSTLMDNLKLAASNLWFSGLGEVTHSITDGLLNWVKNDLQPAATQIGQAIKDLSGAINNQDVKNLISGISDRMGQSKKIITDSNLYKETMRGDRDEDVMGASNALFDTLLKYGGDVVNPISNIMGFGTIKGTLADVTMEHWRNKSAQETLAKRRANAPYAQQEAQRQKFLKTQAYGLAPKREATIGPKQEASIGSKPRGEDTSLVFHGSKAFQEFVKIVNSGNKTIQRDNKDTWKKAAQDVKKFSSKGKKELKDLSKSGANDFRNLKEKASRSLDGIGSSMGSMAAKIMTDSQNSTNKVAGDFDTMSARASGAIDRIKGAGAGMFAGMIAGATTLNSLLGQIEGKLKNIAATKLGGGGGGGDPQFSRGGWTPPGHPTDTFRMRAQSGEFMIRQSTASQIMRNPAQGFQRLAHDMGVQTRPHTAPVVQGGGVQVSYNPVFHINGAANPQATAGSVMQKFERGATMAINKAARASSGLATA